MGFRSQQVLSRGCFQSATCHKCSVRFRCCPESKLFEGTLPASMPSYSGVCREATTDTKRSGLVGGVRRKEPCGAPQSFGAHSSIACPWRQCPSRASRGRLPAAPCGAVALVSRRRGMADAMRRPDPLWMAEPLVAACLLEPGMRVLDLLRIGHR
jgi:hypothetical protein